MDRLLLAPYLYSLDKSLQCLVKRIFATTTKTWRFFHFLFVEFFNIKKKTFLFESVGRTSRSVHCDVKRIIFSYIYFFSRLSSIFTRRCSHHGTNCWTWQPICQRLTISIVGKIQHTNSSSVQEITRIGQHNRTKDGAVNCISERLGMSVSEIKTESVRKHHLFRCVAH